MIVTSFYSSLLAIIFLILTVRIVKIRRANKISFGDGNNQLLQRAIRAHSNFCESAPLVLILMALAENNGCSIFLLHFFGLAFTIGRILHSYGISSINENLKFRISGMMLTIITISAFALINLILCFL